MVCLSSNRENLFLVTGSAPGHTPASLASPRLPSLPHICSLGNPQPRTLHGALSTKPQSKADLGRPHSAHLQSVLREQPAALVDCAPGWMHDLTAPRPGRNFTERLTHPTMCLGSTVPLLCSEKGAFNPFLKIARERNPIISLSKLFLLLINVRVLE